MRNLVKKSGLGSVRLLLAVVLVMCVSAFAFADPPAGFVDYSALVTGAKTEIQTATTSTVPIVFAVLAGMLGVGLAVRWIKKAAKSS